ncbi:hypothetical protein JOB18_026434 [Solea senegalensis]|uniref:Uncharacterized protein n=1 Tax=Solea senegalensis TaxID=28829 RepID=A0AAV6QMH6_SOLSE|nr:hypothetical protein JOB18_026434 [Solea senegalensis]
MRYPTGKTSRFRQELIYKNIESAECRRLCNDMQGIYSRVAGLRRSDSVVKWLRGDSLPETVIQGKSFHMSVQSAVKTRVQRGAKIRAHSQSLLGQRMSDTRRVHETSSVHDYLQEVKINHDL